MADGAEGCVPERQRLRSMNQSQRASGRRQRLTPLPAPRPEPVPHLTHPVASGAVGGIQSPAHHFTVPS